MKLAIRIKQRNRLIGLLVAGIVCLFTTLPLNAQCPTENKAFKSGEHVMYDLYFNWKFIWVKAGIASLTTNATTYQQKPAFRFNLLSVSSKRVDFFFKMRDTLTALSLYISAKELKKANAIR